MSMEYYGLKLYTDELQHHGIAGQKWGHRNGPPYPLGSSDKSSLERKLSKINSNQEKRQKKISKLEGKVEKYKSKVPPRYFTAIGEHKTKKYMVKTARAEGQLERLKKKDSKLTENEESKKKLYDVKMDQEKRLGDLTDAEKETYKKVKDDKYGGLTLDHKLDNGQNISIDEWDGKDKINFAKKATELKECLTKENVDKMYDEIATTLMEAQRGIDNDAMAKDKKEMLSNTEIYSINLLDNRNIQVSLEHPDLWGDKPTPFGDHSLDFEGSYDPKEKKIKIGKNFSMNG